MAFIALIRTVNSLFVNRPINGCAVLFLSGVGSLSITPLNLPSTLSNTEGFAQTLNASIASALILAGAPSFKE